MATSRSRTAFISAFVIGGSLLALALPVAAQVTRNGASQVYQQASVLATIVNFPQSSMSEPAVLAVFGVALAISAQVARRRLLS